MDKKTIMLGMIAGSIVGGYIPTLFGASAFSIASVITGAIGAFIGIWLTYRFLD
jgi:uncharacterized membrane protein YeaQ/YmgE (transglycosylase-associated protein family)